MYRIGVRLLLACLQLSQYVSVNGMRQLDISSGAIEETHGHNLAVERNGSTTTIADTDSSLSFSELNRHISYHRKLLEGNTDIFQDSLDLQWENWSWGSSSKVFFGDTSQAYSGSASIHANLKDWGGLSLNSREALLDVSVLEFFFKSAGELPSLTLSVQDADYTEYNLELADKTSGITITAPNYRS